MRILKRYFVPSADWEPVSLDDFVTFTEQSWNSQYGDGEAQRLLMSGGIVRTQFAEYRIEKEVEA